MACTTFLLENASVVRFNSTCTSLRIAGILMPTDLMGISMKLCYYDAWLYGKVNLLKYKAAFYSLKRKREKKRRKSFVVFTCILPRGAPC